MHDHCDLTQETLNFLTGHSWFIKLLSTTQLAATGKWITHDDHIISLISCVSFITTCRFALLVWVWTLSCQMLFCGQVRKRRTTRVCLWVSCSPRTGKILDEALQNPRCAAHVLKSVPSIHPPIHCISQLSQGEYGVTALTSHHFTATSHACC